MREEVAIAQETSGKRTEPGRCFDRRVIPRTAREWRWRAADDHPIRVIDWCHPEPPADSGQVAIAGSLLFMPGRGDSYEKYLETFEHWRRGGWQVTAADWRGQAGSGRLGLDALTGHIDDFGAWIDDLAQFWVEWAAPRRTAGPLVLAGHSMGGHLVLRALAEGKLAPAPDALVLSAPMLDVQPEKLPQILRLNLARLMVRVGDPRRMAWKWNEKPGVFPAARQALLTHDDARYADEIWWREARPELVMGPGSWGWVLAAMRSIRALERTGVLEGVDIPVLLLATSADRLVGPRAIERAAERLPHVETLIFGAESRHELLRECDAVRGRALARIDAFLASVGACARANA